MQRFIGSPSRGKDLACVRACVYIYINIYIYIYMYVSRIARAGDFIADQSAASNA